MSIKTPETKCDLSDEVMDNIQKLHQANIDSADGFTAAADDLKDATLATQFRNWADDRMKQAGELQKVYSCNGEEINREGSWLAALHRGYITMRQAITSDDKQAILDEAERGEDHIKGAYECVLKDTPGSAMNSVLQRQYTAVKKVHDKVKVLRDA